MKTKNHLHKNKIQEKDIMIKAAIFDMYETLITHYETPLYFSAQMAADAGISTEDFRTIWSKSNADRTTGKLSLENAIVKILKENNCYSDQILNKIVEKRFFTAKDCYNHLHPEIIPMLTELKKRGIKIGLISNCFSEEAVVIRNSILAPYFDAIYLSYEQGVKKPDEEIFNRCINELNVKAEECLFIGDGGSQELEASSALGMHALQAVWYLKEGTLQSSKPRTDFTNLKTPMDVLFLLDNHHI